MEASTASAGVAPPAADQPRRRAKTPAALGWVDELAGMAILTGQTFVAALKPPYSWGAEFLDQCWLVVRRAFIPLLFCTAVFSWGAAGITGGSIIATLATTDRLRAVAVQGAGLGVCHPVQAEVDAG